MGAHFSKRERRGLSKKGQDAQKGKYTIPSGRRKKGACFKVQKEDPGSRWRKPEKGHKKNAPLRPHAEKKRTEHLRRVQCRRVSRKTIKTKKTKKKKRKKKKPKNTPALRKNGKHAGVPKRTETPRENGFGGEGWKGKARRRHPVRREKKSSKGEKAPCTTLPLGVPLPTYTSVRRGSCPKRGSRLVVNKQRRRNAESQKNKKGQKEKRPNSS